MLKPNTSPKSPRIQPSNDTFVEWKCCEVFAQESEAFHRRRSNGISVVKMENKNPQNLPSPCNRWTPCNAAMPRPTARTTAAPTVEALSHTYAVKPPLGYNGAPQMRPKSTLYRGPIPKTRYLPHPRTRPTYYAKRHSDLIRRFSTMHWTDRQTDRSFTGKFDDYRPLRSESDAA